MQITLTKPAIQAIAGSFAAMQSHRGALGAAMNRHFATRDRTALQGADSAAFLITEMLFDHARALAGLRPLQRLEETGRHHRAAGITVQYYSCFGDWLGAAMKDVLGEQASPAVLSAWGDAYWAIVRAVSRRELALAA